MFIRIRLLILLTVAMALAVISGGAPVWLTVEQLSERLQIPEKTLRGWRLRGWGPPSTKLGEGRGGAVRYRLDAVEAWERTRPEAEQVSA